MTVTVIIPNYNHALYLKQRIDSVLNQTFQDFEVIILDDCSKDESREVIEQYRQHSKVSQIVFNEINSGSTFKQWNKGLALAQGKYIWIAESDDFAELNLLETLVSKLEANPEVGIAYCNSFDIDDKNTISCGYKSFYDNLDPGLWANDFIMNGINLVNKYMCYRNIIPNASAVLLRRQTAQEVGMADENFKLNGDWIFWAKILATTKVAFVAEPLNYFRQHKNNVRSATVVNGQNLLELTSVIEIIKQYGQPDPYFFDKIIRYIIKMWFVAMIEYNVPLRKHYKIFKNLLRIDKNFMTRFRGEFQDFMLVNKFSGLRRLLGDGILYRLLRRN
jgi:glycosyltransferase involved in cell wall biosynthesis